MLFNRMMQELSVDLRAGLSAVRTALDDARKSPAFRAVLAHTVRLGSVINFGTAKADADDGHIAAVSGFGLDALSRLALFRAPGNARITLLHVLVAQVLVADTDLPRRLVEEMGNVHKSAKRPISQLAEDITAFAHEAEHATACSSCRSSNAADVVAASLSALSERAVAEVLALREQLKYTRDSAKATLSFFALPAKEKEIDAKALELCQLLSEFLSVFEKTKREITRNPNLASVCHSGANQASLKAAGPRAGNSPSEGGA